MTLARWGAAMNETIFALASAAVLPGWAALLASPWFPRAAGLVAGLAVPLLLAAAYTALIVAFLGRAEGGFGSLAEVMALFAVPEAALAGWVHYLAFDLLVGAMIVRQAREEGVPFLMVLPCLPLTFMLGPAGWLLFQAIRGLRAAIATPREARR